MVGTEYFLIYAFLLLFGDVVIETKEETISYSESDTSVSNLKYGQVSSHQDIEEVPLPPQNEFIGSSISPRKPEKAVIYSTPQTLGSQNTLNIKHEDKNNSSRLLRGIKMYVDCHYRRFFNIIKSLWKRQVGALSQTVHKMADEKINARETDFMKNIKKSSSDGYKEVLNSDRNNLPFPSTDIRVNNKLHDSQQPYYGSNSTVDDVYIQDRQGNIVLRTRRCVGKECTRRQEDKNQRPNYLKQPHHGSNSTFAEIPAEGLKDSASLSEVIGAKRCVGKECEGHDKDDCNGLSPEICKDLSEVKDELKADDHVLTFDGKEMVGLAMIFFLGCFMMYLYIYHGHEDAMRRYMSIGTLALFLLCITVLSQVVSRSQDAAHKKKG